MRMTYSQQIDALTEEWTSWWMSQGLGIEPQDAEEALLNPNLNDYQRKYITHFILRWDAVS